jgi:fucose permease
LDRDQHDGLRSARFATRVQFFALGFGLGTWGVHIPNAKAHFGLDDRQLSWALFIAAVGAVLCLLRAGEIVHRLGPRNAAAVGGAAMMLGLGSVLQVDSGVGLGLLMLILGAGSALMDVAINAEGSLIETSGRIKVMSGFHGMFSVGGMCGAAAGAALARSDWPAAAQLAAVGLALAALIVAASRFMLAVHPADDGNQVRFRRPRGRLLLLGVLCGVGMLAEGAIYDWSVLYVEQQLAAPHAQAALAFASFSAAMAGGRFVGDRLRERFATSTLLATSAALSALAMTVVLIAADPLVALVGFAFVGAGMANLVPILFMSASQTPGVAPSAAIAAVSSLGYLGFVGGPPLVGGIAHALSLRAALAVVVVGCVLVAWGATRLAATAPGAARK